MQPSASSLKFARSPYTDLAGGVRVKTPLPLGAPPAIVDLHLEVFERKELLEK